MDQKYFTIGMAGHIDHGKTSLTKALTKIDTDRLKEEKERSISIELGFAPLKLPNSTLNVSIVDVPGHEKFIRQMIAGVAGIDLVLVTVAADEGVMPQTKEHMDILNLLEVHQAIIVITKIDRVDEEMLELVKDDIDHHIQKTSFATAPIVQVDSISEKGLDELKIHIEEFLLSLQPRNESGAFRLPIDQVFTVKGQGTVIRGTVYDGTVEEEETLKVLPLGHACRARQIQVHNREVIKARAGQRTAINLGGVENDELKRGDVLVRDDTYPVTNTIDVTLHFIGNLSSSLKQRGQVKLHIGTSEVMGRIVFFDRNEIIHNPGEIVCQIRLEEPIVTQRGDRFIIRRPSPVETIGGGWILDPHGEKYRFGQETISMLEKKREGTPEERIEDVLEEAHWLTIEQLKDQTGLQHDELEGCLQAMLEDNIVYFSPYYSLKRIMQKVESNVTTYLHQFHEEFPMRNGANKPDVMNVAGVNSKLFDRLLEQWEQARLIQKDGRFIALHSFTPHIPQKWEKRIQNALDSLKQDGLKPNPFEEYLNQEGVPKDINDELEGFLIEQSIVVRLDDKHLLDLKVLDRAIETLKNNTNQSFSLKEAKDVWGVSRKYLIPLLEVIDEKAITKRVNDKREWL
ncbi:selenocysteine-specific translation elongation factor [Pontibacillus sp. HMF3514]|uniref:selenocysteine-specific translation elongation factor n=1 Tax=Pontibacillus sp. HMF3514 TaxID=2692425 RepID=UPI0013205077|nr:selenocysteine-specific translation elongation factor [Pontibacillus sp. HMF3514]QHE52299.1 selenocysteine-specific translation elongation factor [Pontibacillus sp. HMF3514]